MNLPNCRKVLECGGKWSATPLSNGVHLPKRIRHFKVIWSSKSGVIPTRIGTLQDASAWPKRLRFLAAIIIFQ